MRFSSAQQPAVPARHTPRACRSCGRRGCLGAPMARPQIRPLAMSAPVVRRYEWQRSTAVERRLRCRPDGRLELCSSLGSYVDRGGPCSDDLPRACIVPDGGRPIHVERPKAPLGRLTKAACTACRMRSNDLSPHSAPCPLEATGRAEARYGPGAQTNDSFQGLRHASPRCGVTPLFKLVTKSDNVFPLAI